VKKSASFASDRTNGTVMRKSSTSSRTKKLTTLYVLRLRVVLRIIC
jgi:hypothetical protein